MRNLSKCIVVVLTLTTTMFYWDVFSDDQIPESWKPCRDKFLEHRLGSVFNKCVMDVELNAVAHAKLPDDVHPRAVTGVISVPYKAMYYLELLHESGAMKEDEYEKEFAELQEDLKGIEFQKGIMRAIMSEYENCVGKDAREERLLRRLRILKLIN